MDLEYFKCHIEEELDGAKDYIKRAIEIKPMNSSWGKMLYEMSAQELLHAGYIYNMFMEYVNTISGAYTHIPDYIVNAKQDITDMYTECSAKVKYMQDMYIK